MRLEEIEIELPLVLHEPEPLEQVQTLMSLRLPTNLKPLRFSVTNSNDASSHCAISCLKVDVPIRNEFSIFDFMPRKYENTSHFNVAFMIPTGIGAEIGGHAGDGTVAAQLIAETCDTLILHPNVVNASDINEMSPNSLYVEGSVMTRLLMGTIGIVPVRSNRVLVIIDDHKDDLFANAAINAVSAARASFGLNCPEVVKLSPPVKMKSRFTEAGTAAGEITGIGPVIELLEQKEGEYDAVAISSVISVPREFHQGYFDAAGDMVNPWGGVEAMLTHLISSRFNVPSAHCPMFESREISHRDPGIVDPRMAAEAISLTFFECVLKGLQKSPRIITDQSSFHAPGVFSASDISCLVMPDGCVGLPTLAALKQGIPVIAVRENKNMMKNELARLPWRSDQLHVVENYWEAAGVLCAIRGGIMPSSVRRPMSRTLVIRRELQKTLSHL